MCDYELALRLFDQTCNHIPEAITPRQWRSYLLMAMGRWAEAHADIDWVLQKIDDVPMRLMRIESLYRQSQFDEAIDECTKLIEDPAVQSKRGLALRSLCYEAIGDRDSAQKDLADFRDKIGKDLGSLNETAFASVGLDLSLRFPLEGLMYAEWLEELMGEMSFTTADELKSLTYYRDTLGLVYFRNDRFEKAIASIQANVDPTNECYREGLHVTAMAHAKLGNWDKAQEFITLAGSAPSPHPDDFSWEQNLNSLRCEAERILSNRPGVDKSK